MAVNKVTHVVLLESTWQQQTIHADEVRVHSENEGALCVQMGIDLFTKRRIVHTHTHTHTNVHTLAYKYMYKHTSTYNVQCANEHYTHVHSHMYAQINDTHTEF